MSGENIIPVAAQGGGFTNQPGIAAMRAVLSEDRSLVSRYSGGRAANDSAISMLQGGLNYLHDLTATVEMDLAQDTFAAARQFASHPAAFIWYMAIGAAQNIGHSALFLSSAAQFAFDRSLDMTFGTDLAQETGSQAWANQFVAGLKNTGLSLVQDYRLFSQGDVAQQADFI